MKYFIIYEKFSSGDEASFTPFLIEADSIEKARDVFAEWNQGYKECDNYETHYGNMFSIHSIKEVSKEDFNVLVKHLTFLT